MNHLIFRTITIIGFATLTVIIISCFNKGAHNLPNINGFVGAEFETNTDPITVDSLVTQLRHMEQSEDILLTGVVTSVCKVKGCWMTLKSHVDAKDEVFVKFKDYGFFVPKDCNGRKVMLHGKGSVELTSVEELRHYAEDEGLSHEEIEMINRPKEEFKFLATGVMFLD